MTRREHLLTILAEECAEVAQSVSKALRFGVNHAECEYHGEMLSNSERIQNELCDLLAVVEMLDTDGVLVSPVGIFETFGRTRVNAKKAKVEKYLLHSRECGTLTE